MTLRGTHERRRWCVALFFAAQLGFVSAASPEYSSSTIPVPAQEAGRSRTGALSGVAFVGTDNTVLLARAQTPPAGSRPAAGATVSVGAVSGMTDSAGAFTLEGIPAGLGVLHVSTPAGPIGDFPVTIFGGATAILGAPAVTRAAALAAVKNALSSIPTDPEATIIIGPQEPLPAGTTVAPAYGDGNGRPNASLTYTAPSEQWFIFVNPDPTLRYTHPVEFFFVDAASGALTKLDERSWPLINGLNYYASSDASVKSPDLMLGPKPRAAAKPLSTTPAPRRAIAIIRDARYRTSTRTFEGADGQGGARLLLASLVAPGARPSNLHLLPRPAVPQAGTTAASSGGTTYGLVVEGADESDENADISNITQMFGHGGVPPAYVSFSKPGDSAGKNKLGEPRRKADLLAKFQQQCLAAGPDDTLFLYITAHGIRDGRDGVQLDRSGLDADGEPFVYESLSSSDFDFSKCKACNIIIIIDACYSGAMASGFNDILEKTPCPPNYTIISSTDSTHQSRGYRSWDWRGPTGGFFTNKFLAGFSSQAGSSPGGNVDLTQVYKDTKNVMSGSWRSGVSEQNPLIYVRYPRCPCHPPTETACNSGPGTATAVQTGTPATSQPTGATGATPTGIGLAQPTGSSTCPSPNPTSPQTAGGGTPPKTETAISETPTVPATGGSSPATETPGGTNALPPPTCEGPDCTVPAGQAGATNNQIGNSGNNMGGRTPGALGDTALELGAIGPGATAAVLAGIGIKSSKGDTEAAAKAAINAANAAVDGPSGFLLNGANTAINVTITIFVQDLGVTADMPAAGLGGTRAIPPEPDSRRVARAHRPDARFERASFRMDERVPAVPVPGMALFRILAGEPQAAQVARAGQILYSLVANGNSSGQALELQVFDPSGQLKDPDVPEGTILEPVKQGSAKSLAEMMPGANILKKSLVAYCVDYLKLPPEANMLYRLAPPAVQDKLSPARAVMQAGRELAAAGKFHPDSDAAAYNDSIRQYALWTKIEGWGEDKFGEVFVEKTKQNALSNKIKWTKQIEQAVRGLVPGRWRDISMILDEAQKLPQQSSRPAAQ